LLFIKFVCSGIAILFILLGIGAMMMWKKEITDCDGEIDGRPRTEDECLEEDAHTGVVITLFITLVTVIVDLVIACLLYCALSKHNYERIMNMVKIIVCMFVFNTILSLIQSILDSRSTVV